MQVAQLAEPRRSKGFCADGFAVAPDAFKPVSCGEPIFVGNTAVDIRERILRL